MVLRIPSRGIVISNYSIENIVASTNMGREFDLMQLALGIDGANYEPESFPGLIVRIKDLKTATLVFKSGKIVCTGAKNLEQVQRTVEAVKQRIEAAGMPIDSPMNIVVQNIVASADFAQEINLVAIALSLGLGNVEYEPEQFPGLVYHMEDPKVAMLLFTSGRLVCTGAKTGQDVEVAIEKLKQLLINADLLRPNEQRKTTEPKQKKTKS